MSSAYRVEIASRGQAKCRATHHWLTNTKIAKGELRHGTWVSFQDTGGWHWRHWACVTPAVLHSWKEQCEDDMEMVDGYDELPKEAQDTVRRAIENEHVDDEDWGGDLELNRYTSGPSRGMFLVKRGKKFLERQAAEEQAAAEEGKDADAGKPDEAYAKPKRKRASKKVKTEADDEEDEVEETRPAKKARGKKAVKAETDDDAVPVNDITEFEDTTPVKKSRGKKAIKAEPAEEDDIDQVQAKPAKKRRSKQAVKGAADDTDVNDAKPAKRGRGKKTTKVEPKEDAANGDDIDGEETKPAKKVRSKNAVKNEPDEEAEEETKPAKKSRGKKAAQQSVANPEEDSEADHAAIHDETSAKKKRVARGQKAKSAVTVKHENFDPAVKDEEAAEPMIKNEEAESAAIDETVPVTKHEDATDHDDAGAPIKDEIPENDVDVPADEPAVKTKGRPKSKGKGRSKKSTA